MKGHLYYERTAAQQNEAFIHDLLRAAQYYEINLTLLLDDDQPQFDANFIFFRSRNNKISTTWEQAGFRLLNRSKVHRIANDKYLAYRYVRSLQVPTIPTKLIHKAQDVTHFPSVLKTIDGHGGQEVFLCETKLEVTTCFATFPNQPLISQPFIESNATDVRVFVIGSEIVGAVKRQGRNSFKSNFTLGGTAERYILTDKQEKIVKKIARSLQSDYIGIDFLLLPNGDWLFNEIEDPVGARSLYQTVDFSIADLLMQYIRQVMDH